MQRRLILILGTVLCLVLSVGCQGPAGLSEADQAAIRQSLGDAVKLVNAQDWKGFAALYTEDAMILLPHAGTVQGRGAIQAGMAAGPVLSNFQMPVLEMEGRGDLAYARGTYSMTETPAGGAPIEDRGKYVTILRKQADGSWKTSRDIWNSDLPLPAPPPAAPAKKAVKKR